MTAELATGQRLGPYRLDALLGEGAMGRVWRATHESLGRAVAIKALKPAAAADASSVERFLAEARAVNVIRHENIVECEGLVHERDATYVVMELLDGRTLGAAIEEAGRIAPARAVAIAAQIADALEAAHAKDIVHRDLKPENVYLIHRAGNDDYVKVLDFGIARLRPDLGKVTATETGALVGTPAYMAPEQVRGDKATAQSDVYALGVVLYQMVTGRLPLTAPNMPLMFVATLHETPPRADAIAPDVPRALADVLERALDKEPDQRPAGMAALRHEIRTAIGAPSSGPAPVRRPPPRGELVDTSPFAATMASDAAPAAATVSAPRRRAALIGAGVVGAAGVAVVAWLATRGGAAAVPDAASPDAAAAPPPIDAAIPDAAPPPIDAFVPSDPATNPVAANALAAIPKRYVQGVHVCWEMAHKVERKLGNTATVKVSFQILPDGGIANGFEIEALTFDTRPLRGDAEREARVRELVLECIDRQLGVWRFPASDTGASIETVLSMKSRH